MQPGVNIRAPGASGKMPNAQDGYYGQDDYKNGIVLTLLPRQDDNITKTLLKKMKEIMLKSLQRPCWNYIWYVFFKKNNGLFHELLTSKSCNF